MSKRSRLDEIRRIVAERSRTEGRAPFPNYAELWSATRELNELIYARDRWGDCIETKGVDVTERTER